MNNWWGEAVRTRLARRKTSCLELQELDKEQPEEWSKAACRNYCSLLVFLLPSQEAVKVAGWATIVTSSWVSQLCLRTKFKQDSQPTCRWNCALEIFLSSIFTQFKQFELTLSSVILHMPKDSQCFLYRGLLTPDTGVQIGKRGWQRGALLLSEVSWYFRARSGIPESLCSEQHRYKLSCCGKCAEDGTP